MKRFDEALLERLQYERSGFIEALTGGAAKDFAEYKRLVGVLEGLAVAERELKELQRLHSQGEENE